MLQILRVRNTCALLAVKEMHSPIVRVFPWEGACCKYCACGIHACVLLAVKEMHSPTVRVFPWEGACCKYCACGIHACVLLAVKEMHGAGCY